MRQKRGKAINRVLAMFLSIVMLVAMIPMNVLAIEGMSAELTTNIGEKTFVVNEATEFTFTTTANDDANKIVKGSFVFSNPDVIEKLEYLESKDGNWYEFNGDFGPETGFPMIDGTSTFRATFNQKGTYSLTASMKTVADGTVLCSTIADVIVEGEASTLSTNIEEKVFNVGDATEFTFTTTANDDANTMVKGSFVFSDPDAIEKLEYLESKDGNWYEFNGEFGPETGFPMIDGTSTFRATFSKAGDYTVTTSMKTVADGSVLCTLTSNVTVENKVTVSVSKNDGGTVFLNSDICELLTVDAGTNVNITVNAAEGYQIASLDIGGMAASDAVGKTQFTADTVVSRDVDVVVTFVKVWTVTVNHIGNGNIDIIPTGEGGSVTVESGKDVEITAIPDEGNRVISVIINDEEDDSVSKENDSEYCNTVKADKDYEILITFAPNVYKIEAEDVSEGTVSIDNNTVEYNGSTYVYLNPVDGYTVDTVMVNGTKVENIVKDDSGLYFNLTNIKANQKVSVTFKEKVIATKSELIINSDADLRPDTENLMVLKDGTNIVFSTQMNGIRLYNGADLVGGDEVTQSVSVGTTMLITKVELYYQADGEYYFDWHVVEMDDISIVVDKGDNVSAALLAIPEENENGYHNSNITFQVNAEDTGDYSGISLVEYWITYNKEVGAKTTLYAHANDIKNSFEDTTKLVVDASMYNSKDVKVSLRVVDRAGNEKTVEEKLKINSTRPTVSLDITGTKFDNAQNSYYNDKRELVITVVDREDTFSAENVAKGLTIKINEVDLTVETTDIVWTHNDNVHVGKYEFISDGHYEWNISYTNLAGLSNDDVIVPSDKYIYDFYIDKAAPYDLKVTYEPNFVDVVLETFSFGFYKAPVTVLIEAIDDTATIQQFEYSYTVEAGASATNIGKDKTLITGTDVKRDGNRAYATFTIPAQFRGNVAFSATDKAGRTTEMTDSGRIVVVDTVAPGITVEYDNNEVSNGIYYKADRTATIKIHEANFFGTEDWDYADLYDFVPGTQEEYLVITVTKELNNGEIITEYKKPEFTQISGSDVYMAEISFDENTKYTFDIKFTDRSGNVYDSYPEDKFIIDKIIPVMTVSYDNNKCINENQFDTARTATITVTENNFNEKGIVAKVNNDSYALEWKPVKEQEDSYFAEVPFPGDAHYTFEVYGVDYAGNSNGEISTGDSVAPWKFTVDRSGPEANTLKVTYEPDFIDVLLERFTFGFYKAPVKVKIEAADSISGIDYFTYSYTVADKVSFVNAGVKDIVIDATPIEGTNVAYATFDIPAQFRGAVSFVATNKSGVTASYAEENVVVVDTIAPGITVEYDNNNAVNNNYYNADRKATIKITEANFFGTEDWGYADLYDFVPGTQEEHLLITVTKELNNGIVITENKKPEFIQIGDSDVYMAEILFNENADYTFDIKYTDRSGNVYDEYETDVFTIDKIAPQISIEKANGQYFNVDRTTKITVVEHNFRASDFVFSVDAYNVIGAGDANRIDLSAKAYQTDLQNQEKWTEVSADTWEIEIPFDIEGNYIIGANYNDPAGNEQVADISDTFCIDKSLPENMKITYNPTFIGTILENFSFGFYKAPVIVTIEATDEIAGIDRFVYSYIVEDEASSINIGKSNETVVATPDEGTDRFYATFEIPAQFRGNVSFVAYDKATNCEFLADKNAVIVDNVAPGVNVEYNNNNDFYDNYFMADRAATVTIHEANFFGTKEWGYADIEDDFLVITEGKTRNDGTHVTTKMKPEFVKNGDVYTATIFFNENADYTFDIAYTDRSGNVYDSYEMDKFTVDKIKPVIDVSYNDLVALYANDNQFRTDREATITITEHNFNAADVFAKVTANETEVKSYTEYLKNPANWKHFTITGEEVQNVADGDIHIAKIKYTEEAHYKFSIEYTDMAGNMNDGVNYGSSVAPTIFTIDKTAPTEMDIKINGVSVAGIMDTFVYNKFYDTTVAVKLSANFDISGMDSIKYQKVANISEYEKDGNWINYNSEAGIVVSPSEKFVIYFRAEDRAGNVNIIRSTGIIVDNQKPVGETKAPEIDIMPVSPNANGIHNSNVHVDMKVVDPKYLGAKATEIGHYSGLNKITYKIYTTDTDAVEEGILLDLASVTTGAVFDADKLVSSWSGSIIIDSSKFNSNNVIVEVTATDNAGNSRISKTAPDEIKIDITVPKIEVFYDNNDADSDSFFKADRTATIVVTERNFKEEGIAIALTNSDGIVPSLSNWTKSPGTGNLDDTKWSATITYNTDGDYEFSIEYTDLAGWICGKDSVNYGTSVMPQKFTIDKTLPTVAVSYDNNTSQNTNFYKEARVATIVITEHNLEPNGVDKNRVIVTMTATDDGEATTIPTVSAWRTEGNKHTATINYAGDALYTFDIDIKDKAGNDSADFVMQTFYVDMTAPNLEITGVANMSANNGDVMPVVTYSDTNYDAEQVTITLSGTKRKAIKLDGSYADIHNGRIFTFNNFAKVKDNDDIYTLTATLTDKAGNTSTETIIFSVNRFGSTYALSEAAEKLNGTYVKKPIDVVITETNADKLSNIKITLFKDGETVILKSGTDYDIMVDGGNGQWYHYTYTIFSKNFIDDGVYSITVESDDASGNEAKNDQDTKDTAINFGIDSTLPIINIENLESKTTYALDNLTVEMSVKDNLKLTKVIVELDGKEIKVWSAEELEEIIKNGGNFTFDIAGDSTDAHSLIVYAIDAAGNGEKISHMELPANAEELEDFYVTTNLWVRYYTNKPLFFGSIAGVILTAGLIVFLVVYKNKKNEAK